MIYHSNTVAMPTQAPFSWTIKQLTPANIWLSSAMGIDEICIPSHGQITLQ